MNSFWWFVGGEEQKLVGVVMEVTSCRIGRESFPNDVADGAVVEAWDNEVFAKDCVLCRRVFKGLVSSDTTLVRRICPPGGSGRLFSRW